MVWVVRRHFGRVSRAVPLAALLAGSLSAQDTTASNGKSTLSGVFTEAQALRGEASYKTNCVSCHTAKEYTGDAFKVAWVSRSAFDLFDVIRTQMPEDNPGILPRQDYLDIVAYLFQLNNFPPGAAELPTDDELLKKVRIDAPPSDYARRSRPADHSAWPARPPRAHVLARRRP